MKKYHCCATCKNFEAVKKASGMKYFCTRLGYETKTHFQFNCWDPRDEIKKRLKKDQFKN